MKKITITITDNNQWVYEAERDYCGYIVKESNTGKRTEAVQVLLDSLSKLVMREQTK